MSEILDAVREFTPRAYFLLPPVTQAFILIISALTILMGGPFYK